MHFFFSVFFSSIEKGAKKEEQHHSFRLCEYVFPAFNIFSSHLYILHCVWTLKMYRRTSGQLWMKLLNLELAVLPIAAVQGADPVILHADLPPALERF